jgi:alpha-tubulin suppressor-like RCC1 family protein
LSGAVASLSAGSNHTCAVLTNGLGQCWGLNTSGQLGNGTIASVTPIAVATLQNAVEAVAAWQGDYSCALLSDGTAKCWGANGSGQLGDGSTSARNLPVSVSGLEGAVHLTAGNVHTCALSRYGAYCWGLNANGQLGDGTTTQRTTPVSVWDLGEGVTSIAAGYRHTCAIPWDGTPHCWGQNNAGQIGDGTTTQRLTRTPVSSFP